MFPESHIYKSGTQQREISGHQSVESCCWNFKLWIWFAWKELKRDLVSWAQWMKFDFKIHLIMLPQVLMNALFQSKLAQVLYGTEPQVWMSAGSVLNYKKEKQKKWGRIYYQPSFRKKSLEIPNMDYPLPHYLMYFHSIYSPNCGYLSSMYLKDIYLIYPYVNI